MVQHPRQEWSIYIVRCADNSLYTGITNNLPRRIHEHQSQGAKCAKYLRGRSPIQLVYSETAQDRAEASRREIAIKRLCKTQKEALITQAIEQQTLL